MLKASGFQHTFYCLYRSCVTLNDSGFRLSVAIGKIHTRISDSHSSKLEKKRKQTAHSKIPYKASTDHQHFGWSNLLRYTWLWYKRSILRSQCNQPFRGRMVKSMSITQTMCIYLMSMTVNTRDYIKSSECVQLQYKQEQKKIYKA